MTAIRYRRRRGARWRLGRLQVITTNPYGSGLLAQVIDRRTGNARTLAVERWQLQVRDGHRWLNAGTWAQTTRSLFDR